MHYQHDTVFPWLHLLNGEWFWQTNITWNWQNIVLTKYLHVLKFDALTFKDKSGCFKEGNKITTDLFQTPVRNSITIIKIQSFKIFAVFDMYQSSVINIGTRKIDRQQRWTLWWDHIHPTIIKTRAFSQIKILQEKQATRELLGPLWKKYIYVSV